MLGMRSFGRASVNGTSCDSVVVKVAVQDAAAEALAADGVHVAAAPRLLDPHLNCTVPVSPAPLLVLEISAVSVTLPPETMLVTLGVTFAVVVAFVIVTFSAVDVLAL